MALNIPLVADAMSANGLIPSPYTNERFILRRDDMTMEVKDGNGVIIPGLHGYMHMTNVRIVFVVAQKYVHRARYRSIEIPFRGLQDEAFNQPIFGANNLSGTVIPYEDEPFEGTIFFKMFFKNGGAGTFLQRFTRILSSTRRYYAAFERSQREDEERRAQQERQREEEERRLQQERQREEWRPQASPQSAPHEDYPPNSQPQFHYEPHEYSPPVWYGAPYDPAEFTAIADPTDPSQIYIYQPNIDSSNGPPRSRLKKD